MHPKPNVQQMSCINYRNTNPRHSKTNHIKNVHAAHLTACSTSLLEHPADPTLQVMRLNKYPKSGNENLTGARIQSVELHKHSTTSGVQDQEQGHVITTPLKEQRHVIIPPLHGYVHARWTCSSLCLLPDPRSFGFSTQRYQASTCCRQPVVHQWSATARSACPRAKLLRSRGCVRPRGCCVMAVPDPLAR